MKCLSVLLFAALLMADRGHAAPAPVSVLEGDVLCFRADRISETWLAQVRAFQPTNRLTGLVLDLRFADGDTVALAPAKDFFSSTKMPLVMLVNSQTHGVAANLAAALRAAKTGLIISSTNPPPEISADLTVAVSVATEKIYLADPFAVIATNRLTGASGKAEMSAFVDHMTEAELVRRRIKDGEDESEDLSSPRPAPAQPTIRDPALARALDFFKALAVLHPNRK
jgi:hypothetical protein